MQCRMVWIVLRRTSTVRFRRLWSVDHRTSAVWWDGKRERKRGHVRPNVLFRFGVFKRLKFHGAMREMDVVGSMVIMAVMMRSILPSQQVVVSTQC